ncbi:LysR family transcriptional regulator [Sphingomonas sp. LY54]|uniref:LysR family transcriptional regulator n=1 Tax=Sphingomonas sp. LY54 TaxID=3095343 RepID=UPI002D77005E|nr:LysR family transcriptional regulator [Sphingomonas sp. LY54]WRP29665.1 LysR family transcriptional regulator [Sphingomonas sp. LY54]
MLDLDLNLLTSLSALLQTKSVSQAARRMGISQPAMSRALAELREIFGDPLLVRTRGGMLLTRRAEDLAGPLADWLDGARRLVAPPEVDPATLSRRFRIIASDYGVQAVVRPALAAIMAAAPGVSLDVRPVGGDAIAQLAAGEADVMISGVEPDRRLVHERHLFSEPVLCVARRDHPLALKSSVGPLRLSDLLPWPQISVAVTDDDTDPLSRTLATLGLRGRVVATTPYFSGASELLLETDAVMVLPAGAARSYALGGQFALFDAPHELGRCDQWLSWHTRSQRDCALQWLITLIAAHCADDSDAAAMSVAAE